MAEVSIVPRVRTETQTIQSPISKCGDNWWKDIRVRCAYKGTDLAFRTLPSLGEPIQVEEFDPEFLGEIIGDHERVTVFVSEHLGEISEGQLSNIEKMLSRAAAYIADAQQIAKFWLLGFTTPGHAQVPSWPLNGQPKGAINGNIEEGHAKDCGKWKRLVRSALRNIRCAEEVAKKATIRLRNIERHQQGRRYGLGGLVSGSGETSPVPIRQATFGGLTPIRQATFVGGTPQATLISPDDDGELEEGEIDLEEELVLEDEPDPDLTPEATDPVEESATVEESAPAAEQPAQAPVKKKKDNTLLIAGAAVLGVLALSKR